MKNVKKSIVSILGATGIILMLVFSAAGCASVGGTAASVGTLTITGIPAQYNGQYASFSSYSGKNADGAKWTITSNDAAIANGTVTLDVSAKGATDPAGFTALIQLNIGEKKGWSLLPEIGVSLSRDLKIVFEDVLFGGGSTALTWDEGTTATGSVTVTGIPAEFNGKKAGVSIGDNVAKGFVGIGNVDVHPGIGDAYIANGTLVVGPLLVNIYSEPEPGKSTRSLVGYKPYTESGVTNLFVSIVVGSQKIGPVTKNVTQDYFFESVPFTDGKATLNFSQGVKQ
jgi:hypothetical protein